MEYSPEAKVGAEQEIKDKVELRKKSVEEAKYYQDFLNQLGQSIKDDLSGNVFLSSLNFYYQETKVHFSLEDTKIRIRDLLSVWRTEDRSMNKAVEYAMSKAKELNPSFKESASFRVDPEKLEKMTPGEFFKYIEELKSTLIK
jgi:hypothetical protein